MKFEWEEISSSERGFIITQTCRAKVIGGWLVKNSIVFTGINTCISESTVFVEDPNHYWIIEPHTCDVSGVECK